MKSTSETVSRCSWEKASAHLALIFTQFCFSGWHIFSTIALRAGADPIVFALYREISASILMLSFVYYKSEKIAIEKPDYLRFLYIGFCSFVNVVGTIIALQYIAATRYSLFQPTIPCIAASISIAIGLEPFGAIKALGILLAVGGAVIVEAWKEGASSGPVESNVTLGTILVVIQCFAMANIIVFQKPLLNKYDPSVVTFTYYTIGTGFTILLSVGWESRFTPEAFYFNNESLPWVGLIYATIFATLLAYNLYSWAGKKLSPSLTTVYCTLQPVGTVILSLLVLGQVVTLPEGVGGAVVAIGLVVTVYGRTREMSSSTEESYEVVECEESASEGKLQRSLLVENAEPVTSFSCCGSAAGALGQESI